MNENRNDYSNVRLTLKYPASWWKNAWREALPSGNGKVGAAVYGGVREETVLLNHSDLWHGGYKDRLPDVSHTLEETRSLIREGSHADANARLTNALLETGYATRLASKLPLGDLKLSMPSDMAFRKYKRQLNMVTGEVGVGWEAGGTDYIRKLFVSRTEDVIVYEISSSGDGMEGILSLGLHPTEYPSAFDAVARLQGTVETKSDGPYLFYAVTNDDGTDFGAVLRVADYDGELHSGNGSIRFRDSNRVRVLVKTFLFGEREKDWARLREALDPMNRTYEDMLTAHASEHFRLFGSAALRLSGGGSEDASNEELLLQAYEGEAPNALIEKMWAYGRYLFVSGTASDGMPFGMYGLWPGDYHLDWCLNMANENVQMIYWHTSVGGLSELVPALAGYYESMMDDFRDNAAKLFGCRGIYVPAGSTPGIGVPNQIVPVIMNWTGAAGWLAKHYYEHYLFTGDRTFLAEKALPFMREVALFYEDFAELDERGTLLIYPSVSPENSPGNFMPKDGKPMEHPMPTTINATMDMAILKELLTNLISAARELNVHGEEIGKWKDLLERIPAYQVNEDGAVREWMHPSYDDNYEHRHLSHLYPVFPGLEYTRERDPDAFGAFEIAVNRRKLGAQSGWSLAHMAAIYARMGDGNKALECLDVLSRSCLLNNFFTVHNDWRNMGVSLVYPEAPVQLDASMGWVNAVQEMLLYVSPSFVKLLPAVPDRWAKGAYEGLRFATGTVSVAWDKEAGTFEARMTAVRDTDIELKLPEWWGAYRFEHEDDRPANAPLRLENGCIRVRMKAGSSLRVVHDSVEDGNR